MVPRRDEIETINTCMGGQTTHLRGLVPTGDVAYKSIGTEVFISFMGMKLRNKYREFA